MAIENNNPDFLKLDIGYNNKNNFGEETFLDKFRYNRLFLFIISKCLFRKI